MIAPKSYANDLLLWTDLETTGSAEDKGDEIIEIGCVLTTPDLEELGRFQSLVAPSPLALGRLMFNREVREMHEANGLLAEILDLDRKRRPPHQVVLDLFEFLRHHGQEDTSMLVLAGSGVGHFDRRFIAKYMPQLTPRLRYWVIDVGTIRRAHEMWVGTVVSDANEGKTHRALDDALCHLEEARAFRELWIYTQTGAMADARVALDTIRYDYLVKRLANAQAAYRAGTDPLYACSYDGLHPGNTARWCDVGCGSDYNHMIAVPRETVRALFNFDFVKAN